MAVCSRRPGNTGVVVSSLLLICGASGVHVRQCVEIMAQAQWDLSFSQRVGDTVIRVGEGERAIPQFAECEPGCSRTEVKEMENTPSL